MRGARFLDRGSVSWANLDGAEGREQRGRRPVLVVSDTSFNRRSGTAIVLPMTSRKPPFGEPLAVELSEQSWVKPCQVRTLSTSRLSASAVESVPRETVDACVLALMEILGLDVSAMKAFR